MVHINIKDVFLVLVVCLTTVRGASVTPSGNITITVSTDQEIAPDADSEHRPLPYAKQCGSPPGPSIFFSVPEVERAISTGSIAHRGQALQQNFDAWCEHIHSYKYRTIEGTCNHVENRGASMTPVARLVPPEYEDGESLPRITGVGGYILPSARTVSLHVHPDMSHTQKLTHMVMQWGQWLDHDLSALPVALESDKHIKCCGPQGNYPPFVTRKECFPIELPREEPHFPGRCMEFVRSIPARDILGRELRPREQLNSLTSFIDASQVYGSTREVSEQLRDKKYRYLLASIDGKYLPRSEAEDCITETPRDYCFLAGDSRANEQPGLGALHTIFLREHNRIAKELRRIRRHDSDEEIFQLTRKIIGALQQTITYNEWLPIILGDGMRKYNLYSVYGTSTYNPNVDPRVFNAFSTAAFRFGHSLIPERFIIGDREVPLRKLFNRPKEVLENLDDLVAGLVGLKKAPSSYIQSVDPNFVMEITKFLFVPEGGPPNSGLDLISLNIQRGRDHGIAPYVKYRALCGLRPIYGFDDVEALGPRVGELGKVYRYVEDIDLFTGLMYEPVTDGIVGPTLNCLLGMQFFRSKFGDRFFFDTDNPHYGFTDNQLRTIRRTTLASIICRTTDIEALPINVFSLKTDTPYDKQFKTLVPCSRLAQRGLNLRYFAYPEGGENEAAIVDDSSDYSDSRSNSANEESQNDGTNENEAESPPGFRGAY